ncbi:MAG: peptide chain release factor N(5)-glutamine methyltransferase [Pyrinomonadaceae bacterium]
MSVSIGEALQQASEALHAAEVTAARRDSVTLLTHVTGKDRTYLLTHPEQNISEAELQDFIARVKRRSQGEPVQYIVGAQDFFGREFIVTPDVLIPRPETEILVEAVLRLKNNLPDEPHICDVGTGSGCIAITLLCELEKAHAVALDLSPAALGVARENANRLSVADRISFVVSDCFDSVDPSATVFDVIVSNPPYVAASVVPVLQREVRDYEPHEALTPGGDGLSIIRRLLADSPRFLVPQGWLTLEIGFDQGDSVEQLIDPKSWRLVDLLPDLQNIPRIVVLQKR